ncbi:hypothetical protein [Aldersonia kunmingensis]|uniref:hypothetical protein n=1 Tax=Aldersonia kunmingensis TaxID=408066 RepID=UPI000830F903|nr:hypothetical protein [Aldersonia kunmingensis]
MVDKLDYNEVKDDFDNRLDEIRQLPDKLNDNVDRIKWISPALYLAITHDRDAAQDHLQKLIDTLIDVGEGILAPLLFIDYAAEWQKIGSSALSASNAQGNSEVSLEGHWDGKAYTRYKDSSEHQKTAMTTMTEACQKIHTELLTLAQEGRNFYKQIVDKLATLLAEVGVALAEVASIVEAPWGIDKFGSAIVTAVDFVVTTETSFLEVQSKVWISSNELKNIVNHPAGFPTGDDGKDHWPASVATGFSDKKDWKLAE